MLRSSLSQSCVKIEKKKNNNIYQIHNYVQKPMENCLIQVLRLVLLIKKRGNPNLNADRSNFLANKTVWFKTACFRVACVKYYSDKFPPETKLFTTP